MLLKQEKNEQAQKQIANEFENSIVQQPKKEESLPPKSANDPIIEPPEQFQDRQKKERPTKPTRKPPPIPPKDPFNFDDDMFQTENQSLEKFKINSVQNRQNKKFESFTYEFKVKILKNIG